MSTTIAKHITLGFFSSAVSCVSSTEVVWWLGFTLGNQVFNISSIFRMMSIYRSLHETGRNKFSKGNLHITGIKNAAWVLTTGMTEAAQTRYLIWVSVKAWFLIWNFTDSTGCKSMSCHKYSSHMFMLTRGTEHNVSLASKNRCVSLQRNTGSHTAYKEKQLPWGKVTHARVSTPTQAAVHWLLIEFCRCLR